MKSISLVIESDLGNVGLIAVAVNRVCLELGLGALVAGQIELCIAESATNAIRHAYAGKSGCKVTVSMCASPDELRIEVSDTGTPMPLEHQQKLSFGPGPSEVEPADRRSLSEGGRGLFIIYKLMDKVSYVSEQEGNHLIMIKRLVAARPETSC